MPSPFPGMDPFIESQTWEEFHTSAIVLMADLLNPRLGDRYVARTERRIYIESPHDFDSGHIVPDVLFEHDDSAPPGGGVNPSVEVQEEPVTCLITMPEERRETYLVIKDVENHDVVTVIELLSPSNKRAGTGRKWYLAKRGHILQSPTHLVEIDLLRGGARMPMETPLPPGNYFVIVSEAHRRPRTEVYARRVSDRLPQFPVPLAERDRPIALDLQTVVDTIYDRRKYRLVLNYDAALMPPADEQLQQWIQRIRNGGGSAGGM